MTEDRTNAQVILVVVVALVAGVVGGYIGISAGGCDHSAHASEEGRSDATPPLRSLEDELELIHARGNEKLRRAVLEVKPIPLEVGSETLVYAPTISWKPGEELDFDIQFYRLVGTRLELVDIKKK